MARYVSCEQWINAPFLRNGVEYISRILLYGLCNVFMEFHRANDLF